MIQVLVLVQTVAVLNSVFFYTWLWKFIDIKDSDFVCSCELTCDHMNASISYKLTLSICHLLLENTKSECFKT